MILGNEPQVSISGECKTFNKAKVNNSNENRLYEDAIRRSDDIARHFNSLIGQYRNVSRTPDLKESLDKRMADLDQQKIGLLDTLKEQSPLVAKAIALRTYLSYQHNKENDQSEADYFGTTFFQFVDFSDPVYERMPLVHDAFRSFALTIAQVGIPSKAQIEYTDHWLEQLPSQGRGKKLALIGLTNGFQGRNETAFVKYAEMYLNDYPGDNPTVAENLEKQVNDSRSKMIGAVAPEISLPNPEGDTLRLSDFRGKIVLIDFWASWCGPCRRENPHVKKLYEKYKDQGFEILGVSLDRDKKSWVAAIEKDGLPWVHVSDLKYWQSVAARTYGVIAIPYTVLLDKEGKIAAKKLRGHQLEQKLIEMLEEDID
ncbi:MAG: TlpA family protein disulfide reductase [Bacteroidetes bacterium]|nr:TlpA family protein disulfide reductase [Bacteroidota bacterium]